MVNTDAFFSQNVSWTKIQSFLQRLLQKKKRKKPALNWSLLENITSKAVLEAQGSVPLQTNTLKVIRNRSLLMVVLKR